MEVQNQSQVDASGDRGPPRVEFSNAVRLTGREWLVVGLFSAALIVLAPMLWQRAEPFSPAADYRMPHDLNNDYWLYERWADIAAARYDTVFLGDSVVWGEYTTAEETLSHYFNELSGRERSANLGLDGAHPLALSGLVRYYAKSIAGKSVVLQCNPLWVSSPRADLQDETAEVNHPRLIPPVLYHVPANHEEMSTRLGVVVEQHLPVSSWTTHLQQAYYDRSDIPGWTLEHPYDNPLEPLRRDLPPPDRSRRHDPHRPWYKNGITPQDYPWVDLDTSLQWRAFRDVVDVLRRRDNRVFVLVGPFNEHLLTPSSRARYQTVKRTIDAWLDAEQVPHAIPDALPSELYGDASHPLGEGYAQLARQLMSRGSPPR